MIIAVDFDGTCVKHRYPDDRDYVDWNRIRDILITKNVI